ncbi:MAG TPA: ABC transporter permease, partial [Rhodothermales bacterium]|nr:ABC transporter permease [Rhodothermales bacterium]
MFNLERAIAAWRRQYHYRGRFLREDLDELERHLRDHIAHLQDEELSPQQAFVEASRAVGEATSAKAEYRKVFWPKIKRKGRVLPELRWRLAMLKNYFKIAIRNAKRHKGYAFLNIFGLAVGIACFLLMALYVQHEISYDRHFVHADRIYRVTLHETNTQQSESRAFTPPALAPTLKRDFSAVEQAVRFGLASETLVVEEHRLSDVTLSWGDSTVFEVFSFSFLAGDPRTALTQPNSAVLTRSLAQKLFNTTDVLGQRIQVPDRRFVDELTVTGIIEDIPENTHFSFDLIAPRAAVLPPGMRSTADDQWWFYGEYTYLLLLEPAEEAATQLAAQLPLLSEQYLSDREGISIQFALQPVTSIHLHSHLDNEIQANNRAGQVYLFGFVGLLVLFIACINFMNMATARATRRAREIGVRKVVGAQRRQLIGQFLAESLVLVGVATGLALGLTYLGLPVLRHFADISLPVRGPVLRWLLMGMPFLVFGVGVLAGSYPAFVLTAFRPVTVLKQHGLIRTNRDAIVRKGLVVTQFLSSVALIIGTGVVYQQTTFMQEADPGFDKNHLVVLPIPDALRDSYDPETVRQVLTQHAGIQDVGFSRFVPTENIFANGSPIPEGGEREISVYWHISDTRYTNTLGLRLVEGRDFSNLLASDTTAGSRAFIVNETAVKRFGWQDPIGKALLNPFNQEPMGQVIGVVADFHLTSLQQEIEPLVYVLGTEGRSFRRVVVQLQPGATSDALPFIESQWATLMPDQPFSYFFLDESYNALYHAEIR